MSFNDKKTFDFYFSSPNSVFLRGTLNETLRLKILTLCPEHPKRDQNLKFTPLSETTSFPVCFIWESAPPPPSPGLCSLIFRFSFRNSVVVLIAHFHKWQPLLHSFVFILIRPTALVLKQIFFWNLLVVTRLVGLISIKTKENFIWPPLWKRSMRVSLGIQTIAPVQMQ